MAYTPPGRPASWQVSRLALAATLVLACKNPYKAPDPAPAPMRADTGVADVKIDIPQLPEASAPPADAEAADIAIETAPPPDLVAEVILPPKPCVADTACAATGPCTKGITTCAGDGAEVCEQRPLAEDTPCTQGDKVGVCKAGVCRNPQCGTVCPKPESCLVHRWTCGADQWAPTCDPGTESVTAGTSCGSSRVCTGGMCLMRTCIADTPCGDPKCFPGKIRCMSDFEGICVLVDADRKPNGERCDPGKVCRNGACVDCAGEGGDCRDGCRVGKTSCLNEGGSNPTGEPRCVLNADVPAGMPCQPDEAGRFCRGGMCVACDGGGGSCPVPGMDCKTGTIQCTGGVAVCAVTGNKPNDEACGPNRICRDGTCVDACPQAGQACPTNNPCTTGTWRCENNRQVCQASNVTDNTPCGNNQICRGGRCGDACPRAGTPCTPEPDNGCQDGRWACVGGQEMCQPMPRSAGTHCPRGVCNASGACGCPPDARCTGTSPNPCKTLRLDGCMRGGAPICVEGANVPDRTSCGAGRACRGGNCRDCNDADYCGAQCMRCPTNNLPANAQASCDNGQCGWTCRSGFWRCGDRCVAGNQVTTCTSCGACAPPTGNHSACTNGTACGWTCNPGYHRCGSGAAAQCYDNTNKDFCENCMPCKDWNASCVNLRCVIPGGG